MEIWIIETTLPTYSDWSVNFGYWYDEMSALGWLNEFADTTHETDKFPKFRKMFESAIVSTLTQHEDYRTVIIRDVWRHLALTNVRVAKLTPQMNKLDSY